MLILFINCSNDSLNNSNSTTKGPWSLISDFSGGDETTNMCSNGASMFVGTVTKGVCRSNDYGKTWILVNNGIVNLNDSRVYSDKGILYLSTYTFTKTNAYTGTSIVKYYKSINNGDNWIPIWRSLSGSDIGEQYDITFLNSKIFITCRGSQRNFLNTRLTCVNVSSDNGNTWNTSLITTDGIFAAYEAYTNPVVSDGSTYYKLGANFEVFTSTDGSNFVFN